MYINKGMSMKKQNILFIGLFMALASLIPVYGMEDRKRSYEEFKDKGKDKVKENEPKKRGKADDSQGLHEPIIVINSNDEDADYIMPQRIASESPLLQAIIMSQAGVPVIRFDLLANGMQGYTYGTCRILDDILSLLYQSKHDEPLNQSYIKSIREIEPSEEFEKFLNGFGIKDAFYNLLVRINYPGHRQGNIESEESMPASFEQIGHQPQGAQLQQKPETQLYFRGVDSIEVSLSTEFMYLLPYFKQLSTSGFAEAQSNIIKTDLEEDDFKFLFTILSFKPVGEHIKKIYDLQNKINDLQDKINGAQGSPNFSEEILEMQNEIIRKNDEIINSEAEIINNVEALIQSLYDQNKHDILKMAVQARVWGLIFVEKAFLRFIIQTLDYKDLAYTIIRDATPDLLSDFLLPNVTDENNYAKMLECFLLLFNEALGQADTRNRDTEISIAFAQAHKFFECFVRCIKANPETMHTLGKPSYDMLNSMIFSYELIAGKVARVNKDAIPLFESFLQECCDAYFPKNVIHLGYYKLLGFIDETRMIASIFDSRAREYVCVMDYITKNVVPLERDPMFVHKIFGDGDSIFEITIKDCREYDANTGKFIQIINLSDTPSKLVEVTRDRALTINDQTEVIDARVESIKKIYKKKIKNLYKGFFLNDHTIIVTTNIDHLNDVSSWMVKINLLNDAITPLTAVPTNEVIEYCQRLNDHQFIIRYRSGKILLGDDEKSFTELKIVPSMLFNLTMFPMQNGRKVLFYPDFSEHDGKHRIEVLDIENRTDAGCFTPLITQKLVGARAGRLFFYDKAAQSLYHFFVPTLATINEIQAYMYMANIRFGQLV